MILLAALLATSYIATDEKPAQATPDTKPVKEQKICRKEPSSTSRMVKQVCKTQRQWDAQPDDSQKLSGQKQ